MEFNTRQEMIDALVPKKSVVCELGIFEGEFLGQIYSSVAPSRLVGIDLFQGNMCSGNQDGNYVKTVNLDPVYETLLNKYKGTPVELYKGYSYEILKEFPDDTFDAIYIDADHSYSGCFQDICVAHKKIKSGGWIMGHDYEMNMKKAHSVYNFGVKRAVDEYLHTYKQSIYAKAMDGCVSYAIRLSK